MPPPAIELEGLTKRFGKRRALDDINLRLEDRQIVGVVGPDGAGKTTLIRTLAGLLEIEARRACVLGYDLTADVTELKGEVGYVPQAFGLQRDLSVIENLRFTARLHRLEPGIFEKRSRELLTRTGMAPFATRAAGALSGGMKQKLAVMNALLSEPKLLLLDEPTAGVDVTARAEIWEMLAAAARDALVVISTSYLEEAAACDRLLYLDQGRVIADGTPAALMASVPTDIYRIWSADPRRVAARARQLPYVEGARQIGRYTRIEVDRQRAPAAARLQADVVSTEDIPIYLVEQLPVDMEAALLHFARTGAVQAS